MALMTEGTTMQKNITNISPPVELTHLFMNQDGTLDGSRLFNNAHQFFPKVQDNNNNEIFATKNNSKVAAHSGSTIVLPCTVTEESKFEMVRLFSNDFYFKQCLYLSGRYNCLQLQI